VRYPFWDADVAQLVEHQLPKLRVAGSNPVVRFTRAPSLVYVSDAADNERPVAMARSGLNSFLLR
jgi:hypothetical protein